MTRYWGFSHFRPLQEEIIKSVWEGKDTLGLMPTGGGKSITFQVPGLAKEGICIVITPLIALMKDQVESLNKKGISAVAVHSGMSREEIDITLDNCIYGDTKFLYLSPERIETEIFRVRLEKMNINLVAVDESHCISQWGYDFRPSYLKIVNIRNSVPDVPFLALTATATPKVVEDIMDKLHFRERNVFRKSFERKNIAYRVDTVEDKYQRIISIANGNKGTGIIYVRNRKQTKELALFLQRQGINADHYHAGLKHEERSRKQENWQNGATRIMVATNAFGMGIDKPDVRFVIHTDLPDSLEAYFQEAGRAGRDEKKAVSIVLYNDSDRRSIQQRITVAFPDIETVKAVYQALGNFLQVPVGGGKMQSYDFVLSDFVSQYKFSVLIAHNCLKILEREGYIGMTDEINNPSRIHFRVIRDDLYKFQVENEKYDGFIKLLLRSYTGMFSDYVAIDEVLLARRSGLNIRDVYNFLNHLSKHGIIHYIPRRRDPVIVFTEERLPQKNLRFSVETYQFLKERYIERANNVLSYVNDRNNCRSRLLLGYFGEKDSQPCGHCDICEKRDEQGITDDEFEMIREMLKSTMRDSHLHMDEIIKTLPFQEDKTISVFRWLVEQGKILRDNEYRFFWQK